MDKPGPGPSFSWEGPFTCGFPRKGDVNSKIFTSPARYCSKWFTPTTAANPRYPLNRVLKKQKPLHKLTGKETEASRSEATHSGDTAVT